MALFYTDSIALDCTKVEVVKNWWVRVFDCKVARVPPKWGDTLPSDVALALPGADEPQIVLLDSSERVRVNLSPWEDHTILFCGNIEKAHEYFRKRSIATGPIQESGGARFFEICDPEGRVIEICQEP